MTRATLEPVPEALAAGCPTPEQPRSGRRATGDVLEHAAFAGLVLVWAFYVLPARGGWQADVVPTACLLLAPCLAVLRPWRHCSPALLLLAAAPAVGALVVAVLAPYGDGGPISLARWGYFGGLLLATACYARTPARRAVVCGGLLLVGLQQYVEGWLPWWGGGGAVDGPMLGTIYSANPFGSLMLAFALLAAGIAVLAEPRFCRLGWVVAPFCVCGVVLSGARAAMLLLIGGLIALTVMATRLCGGRGLLRCGALGLASWALLAVSTSSLFFTGGGALSVAAAKGASGQTVESTTGVRIDFWSAAWGEFTDNPVLGGGSGSYMGDSRFRMAPAAERSPFAHNEVLGAFAEGGLVLGLPVLAVFLAGLVLATRPLLSMSRERDAVRRAAGLGAGALLLHALVDFALSFPAILAVLAILIGLCVQGSGPDRSGRGSQRWLAGAVVLVVLGACGTYVGVSHDRAGVSGLSGAERGLTPLAGLRDGRLVIADARAVAADPAAEPDVLLTAAVSLEPLARFDANAQTTQVTLLARAGRTENALALARDLAVRGRHVSPLLLLPYGEQLAAAGERARAFDVLVGEVFLRAAEDGRIRAQLLDVLVEARRLGGVREPGWSCTVHALRVLDALPAQSSPLAADKPVSPQRCAAWAAQANERLGESA